MPNKVAVLGVGLSWGEVEVFGMFLVSRCGQEFSENTAWVFCCFYSPDLHFSFQVILADFMVSDVNGPTMLVEVWLRCQMFSCLIVYQKVISVRLISIELKYCRYEPTRCMPL